MSLSPQPIKSPLETGAHLLAQVVEESDARLIAVCGPMVVCRSNRAPAARLLEEVAGHVERRLAANKGPVSMLWVLTLDGHPETDHELAVATEVFLERIGARLLAGAFVVTGVAFSSPVLREWIAQFADAGVWPTRSFASLEGACGWLARRPSQAVEVNRPRKLFEALSPSLGMGLPPRRN